MQVPNKLSWLRLLKVSLHIKIRKHYLYVDKFSLNDSRLNFGAVIIYVLRVSVRQARSVVL